jgi:exopolyphosphatase/pppGpp-phosphohydrolase
MPFYITIYTATYCVPYITATAAINLTQIIKTVSTLGSSRHSSDKLNDVSTKFYKAPEHLVLATIQNCHGTIHTKNKGTTCDTGHKK